MQPQNQFDSLGPALLGFLCVFLLIALVVVILYLRTLHIALSRVSPRNRLLEPAMVWLSLIPCVNIVWQFIVAVRVPDSLRNEFRDRHQDDGSDYGKSIALIMAVLGLVEGVISRVTNPVTEVGMGALSLGLGLVYLGLFIIFWVGIAGYSRQLAQDDGVKRERWLERFDDEDDFDRRRPRRGGSPDNPPDTGYREKD